MDILVITWNFPPRRGGTEYLLSHLVSGLRKNHSVSVITAYGRSSGVVEKNIFRSPCPGLIPFGVYALWRAAGLLLGNRAIDVIFGGSVMMTPLVLILARLFKRRAVVQAHGLDVIYPGLLYRWLCSAWMRFCDCIIVNSAFTASLAQKQNLPRDQIAVIPLGIHAERFGVPASAEATKKTFQLEGKRIVLFVGRLAKRKGVKEFIQNSLPKITAAVPNVCFVVVGDNPRESLTHRDDILGEMESVIERLGLTKSVRLLGALGDDDVTRLYQACDVVVLPALEMAHDVEGFGIVLLEGAAAGKPVVATQTGGIPDAVEDGKSGMLVEPGDYVGLSQCVIALLTHEETRAAMGENAKRRVLEKFSWKRVIADYETALHLQAKN